MTALRHLGIVLAMLVLGACELQLDVPSEQLPAPLPELAAESAELVELGRLLFWDPILSGNHDVACGSCHHPDYGYGDGLEVSVGVGGRGVGVGRANSGPEASRTPRNAMTVLNTAYNGLAPITGNPGQRQAPMFWDNRLLSLELQALEPIKAELEMRGTRYPEEEIVAEVVGRLRGNAEYRATFAAVFGAGDPDATRLATALAAFQRSLVARDSSFDRYLRGDEHALNAQQLRGYQAFVRGGCAGCHNGPMLSDFQLHHLGVQDRRGEPHDVGDGSDRFRTASLRMVARTGPYMHNGRLRTLDNVFEFYDEDVDKGGDPLLRNVEPPFGTARDDVRAWLESVSDGVFDRRIPTRVPSGLPPGG